MGQKYTILTANGGVIGQFNTNVGGPLGPFLGTLSYDAEDVFLTFRFAGLVPLLPGAPQPSHQHGAVREGFGPVDQGVEQACIRRDPGFAQAGQPAACR